MTRKTDLLLVSSSGGHLAQLMTMKPLWGEHARRWVSFDLPDARARLGDEEVIWAAHPTTRNAKNLIRNCLVAWRVLRERRPTVIISTGAGVAVPFFVLGALLRIPRVYIEVIDRFETPTVTGRICSFLTSIFCVQHEIQLSMYPGARVIGPLL